MPEEIMIADLTIRLKGFSTDNTDSEFEGYVDAGRYPVLQFRKNHPNSDTDYALIEAPHLGDNDTWICTRWRDSHYASVESVVYRQPEPVVLTAQGSSIPESALVAELPDFHDYHYERDRARYPHALTGCNVPLAESRKTNNCCTFVEGLVIRAFQQAHPGDFEWSPALHSDMMIMSADDYFSPITALVDQELGVLQIDVDQPPPQWTVIQGWRQQWRGGHTFIILDHHAETDRVLTLECNSSYGLDGVGFRGLGNLRDLGGQPPAQWWDKPNVWTWQRVCATYRYRKMAALKVSDIVWASSP